MHRKRFVSTVGHPSASAPSPDYANKGVNLRSHAHRRSRKPLRVSRPINDRPIVLFEWASVAGIDGGSGLAVQIELWHFCLGLLSLSVGNSCAFMKGVTGPLVPTDLITWMGWGPAAPCHIPSRQGMIYLLPNTWHRGIQTASAPKTVPETSPCTCMVL